MPPTMGDSCSLSAYDPYLSFGLLGLVLDPTLHGDSPASLAWTLSSLSIFAVEASCSLRLISFCVCVVLFRETMGFLRAAAGPGAPTGNPCAWHIVGT